METVKVGVREFRENLATYLLDASAPVAITRHGNTVGVYIPVRPAPTEADIAAFRESGERWQKVLDNAGITEEEALADFKQWRKEQRR